MNFFFFLPSQSCYETDYFYSVPEVLCLQEFNKFTFSKWLNKTLGGEHLVATSIQIRLGAAKKNISKCTQQLPTTA